MISVRRITLRLARVPAQHDVRYFSATIPDALRIVAPGTLPSSAYAALVSGNLLRPDDHQQSVLPMLDKLHANIGACAASQNALAASAPSAGGRSSGGFFSSLFGGQGADDIAKVAPRMSLASAPRGIYLHGGTGCGKTLLMDIFVACAPPSARARRVHFHAFMRDVNARLHAERQKGVRGDLLVTVAASLIRDSGWLLCFDEVQVTDVGDALILRRLFDALFSHGLVMLATSNRAPRELYAGGLQREMFLPFVDAVHERCVVREVASPTDHRLLATRAGGSEGPWIAPARGLPAQEYAAATASTIAAFERAWTKACGGGAERPSSVAIEGVGRALLVPRAAGRVARFTFDALCGAPLSASDFAALAKAYTHIFVEGIPRLGMSERNELRRLITLIDVLYDARVRLTATAAAAPEELFDAGENEDAPARKMAGDKAQVDKGARKSVAGRAGARYDEVFAWDRAVSRLIDMSSVEYKEACEAEQKARQNWHAAG
jgi:predicted ATPase